MRSILLTLLTVSLFACGAPQEPEEIGDRQYPGDLAEDLDAPTEPIDEVLTTTQSEDPQSASLQIHPIYHGSLVIEYGDETIFVDPYGGADRYASYPSPDLILITHTHGDHMDKETLMALPIDNAVLTGPEAVITSFDDEVFAAQNIVRNGEESAFGSVGIKGIPAYNLPGNGKIFHPKGEFNGYVLTFDNYRVYIAGDTGPIPEMKALENIDYAFVPMNQPYTMTVEQAAQAVAEFRPTVVYPYHYRNQDESLSDIDKFENMLRKLAPDVEVRRADWYPELGK